MLRGILIRCNCYFQIQDMDLNESIYIISSTINEYYDDRLYQLYLSTNSLRENFITFDKFKKDCRGSEHHQNNAIKKLSKKEKEDIENKNNKIISMFAKKKSGDR